MNNSSDKLPPNEDFTLTVTIYSILETQNSLIKLYEFLKTLCIVKINNERRCEKVQVSCAVM